MFGVRCVDLFDYILFFSLVIFSSIGLNSIFFRSFSLISYHYLVCGLYFMYIAKKTLFGLYIFVYACDCA